MGRFLDRFVDVGRGNAVRCWLAVAIVLAIVAYDLWTGAYLGAVLGVGVVVATLGPTLAFRGGRALLPWEVVAVAAGALLVRTLLRTEPLATVGTYVVVAAVALALAAEVHVYTRVEMNRAFATAFVAMVTMAGAAAWAVGRWAVDHLAGTTLLADNEALMGELLVAAGVGVAAGVVFELYFARREPSELAPPSYERPPEPRPDDDESPFERARRNPELAERLGVAERHQRRLVRAMQAGLLVLAAAGVLLRDATIALTGVGSLAVTLLPGVLQREWGVPMGVGLTLWVATAAFLHALGTALFYGESFWWHNLTHAVSGSLIAGIGYAAFRAVDEYTGAVRFPSRFMGVLIVLFVVSVGVVWEIGEFLTDRLVYAMGGQEPAFAQYGLDDTITDMLFNVGGALVVAIWGTNYLGGVAAGLRDRFRAG